MNKSLRQISKLFLLLLLFIQPASAHSPGTFILVISIIFLIVATIANLLKFILLRRLFGSNSNATSGKIVKIIIVEFTLMGFVLIAGMSIFPIDHYFALASGFLTYSILAIIPNFLLFYNKNMKFSEMTVRSKNIMRAFLFGMIFPLLLIFLGFISEFFL